MSLAYRILYAVGFTPWEQMAHPQIVGPDRATSLPARRKEREPPDGPALDLGCGSGIWAVALAQRGWHGHRRGLRPEGPPQGARAGSAGGSSRSSSFKGDVTKLDAAGVGSGFRLLLDFGSPSTTSSPTSSGPKRAAQLPRPLLRAPRCRPSTWKPAAPGTASAWCRALQDIQGRCFPEWSLVDDEAVELPSAAPGYVKKGEPRFYRLLRDSAVSIPAGAA